MLSAHPSTATPPSIKRVPKEYPASAFVDKFNGEYSAFNKSLNLEISQSLKLWQCLQHILCPPRISKSSECIGVCGHIMHAHTHTRTHVHTHTHTHIMHTHLDQRLSFDSVHRKVLTWPQSLPVSQTKSWFPSWETLKSECMFPAVRRFDFEINHRNFVE